jgi:putative membrane protein
MTRRCLTVAAVLVAVAIGSTATSEARPAVGVSPLDEMYLQSALQGDRFEVAGGKIAQSQGQNAKVKALGARLAKDHGKSLKEAVALAKTLHIKVPKKPTPSQQWELSIVKSQTGAAFDRWYADLEVQDHRQDIEEASNEKSKGANAKIRASAAKELPILRKHLALSRAALKSVGK